MPQYLAFASFRFGQPNWYQYVTTIHSGAPIQSYTVNQYTGRARATPQSRYRAHCWHCKWEQPSLLTRKDANAKVKQHMAETHPGRTHVKKAEYRVTGHCIQHAGAIYTPQVDRELRPFDPDEPTHRVADGLDESERLPWNAGYITFISRHGVAPHCPQHNEPLKDYEVILLSLDGIPASWVIPEIDQQFTGAATA